MNRSKFNSSDKESLKYAAAFIALSLSSPLFRGCVLYNLWLWFFVPAFGFPEINLASSIGILLVASLLLNKKRMRPSNEKNLELAFKEALYEASLKPTIILSLGWVVSNFI